MLPPSLGRFAVFVVYLCLNVTLVNGKKENEAKSSSCPGENSVEDGKDTCYYYHNGPKTWAQAQAACGAQGGLLAVFCNRPKAQDVLQKAHAFKTGASTQHAWVGITRVSDNTYTWTDGSKLSGDLSGRVSNHDAFSGAGCVAVDMENGLDDAKGSKGLILILRECDTSGALSYLCYVDTANPVWTSWSAWSQCSATCGSGNRGRQRTCLNDQEKGKDKTSCKGDDSQKEDCSQVVCPAVAAWTSWSTWSQCSATCGSGNRGRQRTCLNDQEKGKGKDKDKTSCKGDDSQKEDCSQAACPAVAAWTSWSAWSQCSATCGSGNRGRQRTCLNDQEKGKGKDKDKTSCKGDDSQKEDCSQAVCPAVAAWTSWSAWSQCSATCGSGNRGRQRTCQNDQEKGKGKDKTSCKGDDSQKEACSQAVCPAVAAWTSWSAWSQCSATCGSGNRGRQRTCQTDQEKGKGKDKDKTSCKGDDSQKEDCSQAVCPAIAAWTSWSAWSQCSATCGSGNRGRQRTCQNDQEKEKGKGKDKTSCKGDDSQKEDCSQAVCPAVAAWTSWSAWSQCSATCGSGNRGRQRTCQNDREKGKGKTSCKGDDSQTEDCSQAACPAVAAWASWSAWSQCSATCGSGNRGRQRTCLNDQEKGKGKDKDKTSCKGDDSQKEDCSQAVCPEFSWQDWSQWTACSATCDQGQRSRSRRCVDETSGREADKQCKGEKTETTKCEVKKCAVYSWQAWGQWTACSATCDQGQRSRSRRCVDETSGSEAEKQCKGEKTETTKCEVKKCAVYVWGTWAAWSTCSQSCDGGQRSRSRRCVHDSIGQGQAMEARQLCVGGQANHIDKCNVQKCPVIETWGEWSACSVSCGRGVRTRERSCDGDISAENANGKKDVSAENANGNKDASAEKDNSKKDSSAENANGKKDVSAENANGKKDVSAENANGKKDASAENANGNKDVSAEKDNSKKDVSAENANGKKDVSAENANGKKDVSAENANGKKDVSAENANGKKDVSAETADSKKDASVENANSKKDASAEKAVNKKDASAEKADSKKDSSVENADSKKDASAGSANSKTAASRLSKRAAADNPCSKKSSEEHPCFRKCKGVSKKQFVAQIKASLSPERAARLELWAERTERVEENMFNARNVKDRAMLSHVLATVTVAGRTACVLRCIQVEGCKSFNFRYVPEVTGQHVCELNSANRDEAIADVRARTEWVFYDLSPFVPYLDEE